MQRLLFAAICILTSASVLAQEPRVATITITPPTKYVDGSDIEAGAVITYNLYQGQCGATKPKVAEITQSRVTVNSGLQPGRTCWQATAVIRGVEGVLSDEGSKEFPWPAAEKVIITVQ